MKCPKCNGKGSVYNALGRFYEDCGHCQGTGMVSVEGEPMTEQEYLQTCTTEQLAEWMALRLNPGILLALRMKYHCTDINAVREWLKEKHD